MASIVSSPDRSQRARGGDQRVVPGDRAGAGVAPGRGVVSSAGASAVIVVLFGGQAGQRAAGRGEHPLDAGGVHRFTAGAADPVGVDDVVGVRAGGVVQLDGRGVGDPAVAPLQQRLEHGQQVAAGRGEVVARARGSVLYGRRSSTPAATRASRRALSRSRGAPVPRAISLNRWLPSETSRTTSRAQRSPTSPATRRSSRAGPAGRRAERVGTP